MENLSELIEQQKRIFERENTFNNGHSSKDTYNSESGDSYYANANWFGNLEPLKAPEGLRGCSLCRDDEFLLKIKKLK